MLLGKGKVIKIRRFWSGGRDAIYSFFRSTQKCLGYEGNLSETKNASRV